MQQENNFYEFGVYANQQNPLDFLDDPFKRKPRSSMESRERTLEIPICGPAFIHERRDSNRSRRFLDVLSPH